MLSLHNIYDLPWHPYIYPPSHKLHRFHRISTKMLQHSSDIHAESIRSIRTLIGNIRPGGYKGILTIYSSAYFSNATVQQNVIMCSTQIRRQRALQTFMVPHFFIHGTCAKVILSCKNCVFV